MFVLCWEGLKEQAGNFGHGEGSTGVQRYGCILPSAANNFGEIPENWKFQMPCFKELFWGGNTLAVPASLPYTLGYACTFYDPASPHPKRLLRFVARTSQNLKTVNQLKLV